MRNVIYSINLTIDGCCDHTKMSPSEELLDFYANLIRDGLLVYGRITYELMVPYWPDIARNQAGQEKGDIEFAEAFDSATKVVFSQSLDKVEDKNSRLIRTTKPENEILKLKKENGKDILLGGVALPSYLIERGLVDEYIFVIQPVLAGEGRRFLDTSRLQQRLQLKLAESKTLDSGAVVLHYLKK